MARRWPQTVVPLGVLSIAFAAACGSGSSTTGDGSSGSSGHPGSGKDAAASGSNFGSGFGDDDSSSGSLSDDAAGDDAGDATVGDDATSDDAAGDDAAGNDAASDDASDAATADGEAGTAAGDGGQPDATAEGGAGPDASVDAGTSDGGDAGGSSAVDAGPDASMPDGGSTAGDGGSSCDFSGTWASEISIDVTWAAGGILDIVIAPGSGTIKQWIRSTRTLSGTSTTDSATVCGIALPDFHGNPALADETYGIRFPDDLFTSGDLGNFAIHGTISGSTPTATLNTTPAAVLLGLALANPTTAVWPATITTGIDEDLDGEGGVTADVAQGGGFSNVPLDFSVVLQPTKVARADRLYLAIRQVTSMTSKFSDCNHAAGSVTVPQITDPTTLAKKYAIDSHVLGCRVAGGTTDCTSDQTSFVDANQPVFVPSASSFTSVRMPAGASCTDVRAALP